MSINIKSPAGNLGKGTNSPTKGGEFNGEPGYQKRTSTPNGPKERTYESERPTGTGLGIKTPSNSNKIVGK